MALPTKRPSAEPEKKIPLLAELDEDPITPIEDEPEDEGLAPLDGEVDYAEEEDDYGVEVVDSLDGQPEPPEDDPVGQEEIGWIEDPLNNDLVDEQPASVEELDKFIDKKNKKIKPFGAPKSKRPKMTKEEKQAAKEAEKAAGKLGKKKIKTSDFDDRRNKATTSKILQLVTMIVLIVVMGLGVKNTWFPENNYTQEEVEGIARAAVGQTSFPRERAQSVALEYMTSYLNYDYSDNTRANVNERFLGKDAPVVNPYNGQIVQKILTGPTVYETIIVSDESEQYKITARVTDLDGSTAVDKNMRTTTSKWVSFAVNVYWDQASDSVSIVGEPMLVPTYVIDPPESAPYATALGNGVVAEVESPEAQPTIHGFIQSYMVSNEDDWDSLKPYIAPESIEDLALRRGFGGEYKLAGDGVSSIGYIMYYSTNPNEYKVDITLTTKRAAQSDDELAVEYTTRYVMTLRQETGNKFYVVSFKPYLYVPYHQAV